MNKPQLLLPAKSFPSLKCALKYADCIYFGTTDITMRKRTGFKRGEIKKVVEMCHEKGKKAYLTLNTVVYNNDIKKVEKIIDIAKEAKVDALIVWDPAAIEIAKNKNMEIHISTQANISNYQSCNFYQKLGAKRVVLSRELSLKEIKKIKKNTSVEIEAFVHGAMCISISGRCHLSTYLTGKSANCGECVQPCRREYFLTNEKGEKIQCDGKYLLSAKDLCMIEYVPELIKAGIDAFKVEGRLRDARYVSVVGRCYREAIDSYFDKTFTKQKAKEWKKQLEEVYNRGFSTGFYFGFPGKEDLTLHKADNVSKKKRTFCGYVSNYFKKAKAMEVRLTDNPLKVGDEMIVEGNTTYIEGKIESITLEEKFVDKGEKTQIVGIGVNEKARKNDKVYIIKYAK
ncbi:MAG: U32 family peptidase [Candidatus Aenigmarchaeota archaeon]|nr:U32 family peptidase [Candidatus Aenigmarchaeota archaeon]